jgi:hypothetical protein
MKYLYSEFDSSIQRRLKLHRRFKIINKYYGIGLKL